MKRFIRSLKYAFSGIIFFLRSEGNAKIQFVIFFLVIIAGFLLNIDVFEWLVILLFGALILSLEAINTAIEKLTDEITSEHRVSIKRIKDVAAGAVLIASVLAAIAGLMIFLPRLLNYL